MLNLILASFACYRLSLLITQDEGPFSIFQKLRNYAGGYNLAPNGEPVTNLGRGIICPLCVGLWIALPLAILINGLNWYTLVYWLAIAGIQAVLIGLSNGS